MVDEFLNIKSKGCTRMAKIKMMGLATKQRSKPEKTTTKKIRVEAREFLCSVVAMVKLDLVTKGLKTTNLLSILIN